MPAVNSSPSIQPMAAASAPTSRTATPSAKSPTWSSTTRRAYAEHVEAKQAQRPYL